MMTAELGPYGFLILGVGGMLAIFFDYRDSQRDAKRRSARTVATVIGHELRASRGHRPHQHYGAVRVPRLRYRVSGQDYERLSEHGATWIIHPVGSQVSILFDPNNPEDAELVLTAREWFFEHLIFAGLFTTFAVMTLIGLWLLLTGG